VLVFALKLLVGALVEGTDLMTEEGPHLLLLVLGCVYVDFQTILHGRI
jgi:hypothetical protein